MLDTIPYVNSVFEQPWYLNIVAPNCWHEALLYDVDGNIVVRWPYVLQKKHFGNVITMPPLTQTLGIWRKKNVSEIGNAHLREQKEQIAALLSQFPKTVQFEAVLDSSTSYILPFRWHGFRFFPTFSYRIEDLTDLEAVYNNFYKTAKKNIKTARHKVEIQDSADISLFLGLLDETFEMQNRKNPMSHELVTQLIQGAFAHEAGKLFLAFDEKRNLHSGAFFLYDEHVCYYLLGGTNPKFRSSGAQSLVLWEAIQFAATVSQSFDFEGSMVEGIENFFKQFGGHQVINYHISKSLLITEVMQLCKPRIKRMIKYKM